MQYAIEAIDTDGMYHKQGVGRQWQSAVRAFQELTTHHTQFLKSAKLTVTTDTGHKLDTIYRYNPKSMARVA